jgi:hypothetical protein
MFGRLPHCYILSLSQSNISYYLLLIRQNRPSHLGPITLSYYVHFLQAHAKPNRTVFGTSRGSPVRFSLQMVLYRDLPTATVAAHTRRLIALQEMIPLYDQPPPVTNGRTHHNRPAARAQQARSRFSRWGGVNGGNVSKLPCSDGISVMLICQNRKPCSLPLPLVSSTCQSLFAQSLRMMRCIFLHSTRDPHPHKRN